MDLRITPETIRAQLERILASEAFVRSRRMQRFLAFIVEETLAGRADQLGEYGIGMAVFDRSPDFEPAVDPIVRNDARRLRLKLLEYYRQAHSGPPDGVVIDVPKGGYVPVFLPASSRNGRALALSLTANLTNLDLEASDRCRVVINLIRVPDGTQIWAREYEFEPA